jgi:hypothetical protein
VNTVVGLELVSLLSRDLVIDVGRGLKPLLHYYNPSSYLVYDIPAEVPRTAVVVPVDITEV